MQLEDIEVEEEFSEDGDNNSDGSNGSEEKDDVEAAKREPYNDQAGLLSKLNEIKLNLDWCQTLDITTNTDGLKLPGTDKDVTNEKKVIKDDFQREMHFYCQAQAAAKEALHKLQELGIPTQRPEDYFAEMVKSDGHMQKVRKKLLEKKDRVVLSEKAKRQRELKKIGKKIQQDVLQKRQGEKKKMLEEVDRMKKGKSQKLYGDGDDPFDVSADKKSDIGKKRKRKDEKFGHGGRKRKLKKNSAESAADMTSFKSNIHGKARNKPMGKTGSRNNKGKTFNHNKGKKRGKKY